METQSVLTKTYCSLNDMNNVCSHTVRLFSLFSPQLSTVIGVTWILAYLHMLLPNSDVVSYIYVILNSLQGFFIFLAFGFNGRVRAMWQDKYYELAARIKSTGTSGSQHSDPKKYHVNKEAIDMEPQIKSDQDAVNKESIDMEPRVKSDQDAVNKESIDMEPLVKSEQDAGVNNTAM